MKKVMKSILIILLSLLIAVMILWLVMFVIREQHQKKVKAVIPLVKEEVNAAKSDILTGCVYNEEFIIISLNHKDYFVVKNNQVRVFDHINRDTKEKFPDIPVDDEFVDLYWVLENCR